MPRKIEKGSTTKKKKKVPEVLTPEIVEKATLEDEPTETQDIEGEFQELDGDISDDRDSNDALPILAPSTEVSEVHLTEEVELPVPHQDLLKQYLAEVSKYALLTPEEEFALAVRLKETGDLEAARRLVSANLRLVVKIAMEYRSAYQNVMDLIQEGNVGLMKAVSKFDPSKGAKLSYYASWWIRSYILKYILDNFRLVRLGTTQAQKKLFFHLMREKDRLEAQGFQVGPKLLADRLQVREQDVVEMQQRLSGRGAEMSLNQPVGAENEGENRTTHQDLLPDGAAAPDDQFEQTELKQIIKEHLDDFAKTLKEKELAVFQERLAAEQPKTLQEVADLFGLTRERARQIEVRVIEKLREYYKQYIR
ncbi:MAG: RNA polymerase factor sigma-32 [Bdellovibrionota bacterium]